MGASFRSRTGSPACTATVSECDIGSAYLKAFKPSELVRIAESFEDGQAGVHLIVVPGEQCALAGNKRHRGARPGGLEQVERAGEPIDVASASTERALRLRMKNRKFAGLKSD